MKEPVYCENCRYYQPPDRPHLFTDKDAHNPETSQFWLEWEDKLEDRHQKETDQARDPRLRFSYKPWFLPVCERWTEMGRSNWEKDAYGNPIQIYELCYTHNKENDCDYFDEKPS